MKKFLLIISAVFFAAAANAQCTAIIDYQMSSTGNAVIFTDSSLTAGGHSTWWDFGDGTSGAGSTATHFYNVNGNVTVCMYISDSIRGCYDSTCITISVTGGTTGCNALFYYSISSVNYRTILFSNTSSGSYGYLWEFGDGDTSTAMHPMHTYAADTMYRVVLYTFDSSGNACDTFIDWVDIMSRGGGCQTSGYVFLDSANYRTAHFVATSNGAIAYYWEFGDGDTSSQQNPSHTYAADSVYLVLLVSFDSSGMPCDSVYISATVMQPSTSCNATFGYSGATTSGAGWAVQFYSYVNVTGVSYYWDFDDGSTSTAANPNHVYSSTGTYNVTLKVGYSGTICDSLTKPVYVDSTCGASFYVAIDTSATYSVYLVNNSYGVNSSSTNFYWDFGDGTYSTSATPTHSYSSFGLYYVCLTLSDSNRNCQSTFCDSVGMDSNGNLLKKEGFTLIVVNESDLTSVNELKGMDVKLYPNPSDGNTTLVLDETSSRSYVIHIYNSNGVLVETLNFDSHLGTNEVQLDLTDKSKGLYFIHLSSDQHYKTLRFIHN